MTDNILARAWGACPDFVAPDPLPDERDPPPDESPETGESGPAADRPVRAPVGPHTTEIVHTWPDGREEVRYRHPHNSPEALAIISLVLDLQCVHGAACPYSFRHVA